MATFAYSGVQAGKRVNGEINAADDALVDADDNLGFNETWS